MKLKRFLCLFLLIAAVLVLVSCGGAKNAKHTVTFNSNGGTPVASQVVKSGSPAFQPTDPTREGYIFLGWYKGNNKWDFSKPVTSDMTLVAEWQADVASCNHSDSDRDNVCDNCGTDLSMSYTITYRDGWRTLTGLKPASYKTTDPTLPLPSAPAKAHYEFVGWYTDEDFTEVATEIDTSKRTNLTFYAKYLANTYTITYNLNGGVNSDKNPSTYTAEKVTLKLDAPTRDGYLFLGWYTDNAFTQPIEQITKNDIGNITLYARWASPEDEFTVTYYDGIETKNVLRVDTFFKSVSDQPLRSSTEFPELNVEGYSFLAWVDVDGNIMPCVPANNSDNLEVYASLKNEAEHNILYYVDGGYLEGMLGAFKEIEGLDTLYVPTKAGYVFDGWYANRNFTGDKITSIPPHTKENVNLYGRFIPNTYSITFEVDGAPFTTDLTEYSTSETDIKLPAIPEKAGHIILGWYTSDGKLMEENKIAAGSFGDLELHAEYEKLTYRITYYVNGGVNDPKNVTEYRHDEVPTLYDPLYKSGYKFAGWYTTAEFSGNAISDLTAYANQDISLFAKWEPDTSGSNNTETPWVPF